MVTETCNSSTWRLKGGVVQVQGRPSCGELQASQEWEGRGEEPGREEEKRGERKKEFGREKVQGWDIGGGLSPQGIAIQI